MTIRRLRAFFDLSAWVLFLPAIVALFFIDRPMTTTLLQWVVFAPALAGVAIVISKLVFPTLSLGRLLYKVYEEDSMPAAIVLAALILFVAFVFYTLVFWSRV